MKKKKRGGNSTEKIGSTGRKVKEQTPSQNAGMSALKPFTEMHQF